MSSYTIKTNAPEIADEHLETIANCGQRAEQLMSEKDFEQAEELWRSCLSIVADHAASLAGLAICVAENRGRFVTAEKIARKAVLVDPDLPDGYLALGRINRLGSRNKRARQLLERARRLAPEDPRIKRELALISCGRKPVISDLPPDHGLNVRLGQLRDLMRLRLRIGKGGLVFENAA